MRYNLGFLRKINFLKWGYEDNQLGTSVKKKELRELTSVMGAPAKKPQIVPGALLPHFGVDAYAKIKLRTVRCCPSSVWELLQKPQNCALCAVALLQCGMLKNTQITPCVLLPYFSVGAPAKPQIVPGVLLPLLGVDAYEKKSNYAMCAVALLQCGCFCKKRNLRPVRY